MRGLRIAESLLALLLAAPVWGGVPYRLADANRAPLQGPSAFLPAGVSGFFQLGDRLLFSTVLGADNGILWSTDGTAQGTVQISSSLCLAGCGGVEPLASWHGLGLFSVLTDSDGYSFRRLLARTDGTPGGTCLSSSTAASPGGTATSGAATAARPAHRG